MRYLYFACISSSIVLFICNHAQARIGETYEESVKRYEAAGFKKERTRLTTPPDDKGFGYSSLSPFGCCTELTWTNENHEIGKPVHVVSILQVFYGDLTHVKNKNKPWQEALRCFEITYRFKDPDFSSKAWQSWKNNLVESLNKDAITWKKRGHDWDKPPAFETSGAGGPNCFHIRFDHSIPRDFTHLFHSGHPSYVWDKIWKKKRAIERTEKEARALNNPVPPPPNISLDGL